MSASISPLRKPADRHHHGDLPAALVSEVGRLMREHGGPEFTLRELADLVGVSHSSVYRHFADRESLLRAVALHGFALLAARRQALPSSVKLDPWRHLQALCELYARFAREDQARFRVMFDPHLAADPQGGFLLRQAQQQQLALIRAQVVQCQLAGRLPAQANAQEMASLLWAVAHGLGMLLGAELLDAPAPAAPDDFLDSALAYLPLAFAEPASRPSVAYASSSASVNAFAQGRFEQP